MNHYEGTHIENLEVTEANLIQKAIEADKKLKEQYPEIDSDIIKAASLCACAKRFGSNSEIVKESIEKLFHQE